MKAAPAAKETLSSTWPLAFLLVLTGLTAVSGESLWIDEANSALKAMQPNLAGWWNVLVHEKGSDLQMPLYMLQLWAWEKVFGHTEFALRSLNIVWLGVGQLVLFHAMRRFRSAALLTVVIAAITPLLWFYLNDARPYILQYAGACFLCAVLFNAAEDPFSALRPGRLWLFGAGLFVLCGSSLLGVIWAGGAVAAWLVLAEPNFRSLLRRQVVLPMAFTALCLAFLGAYYSWTIWLGTGASNVGHTRLLNLAFISYEFSGISGWGPGRLQIRQDGLEAFFAIGPWRLAALVAVAFLALGVFFRGLQRVARSFPRRTWIAMLIYSFPPGLLLLALGYLRDFRLLGRHFIPLVPLVLGLMALGILHLAASRRRLGLAAGVAVCSVWLLSSLSLRFNPIHRKDDYRAAAAIARDALAKQESVWWSADPAAATYYGVPYGAAPADPAAVTLIIRRDLQTLSALPQPALVIASKPDIYEGTGDTLGEYLLHQRYSPVRELPAFTIWRRSETPAPAP